MLALVEAMSDSPYLSDPGEYRHGKQVFFDILGQGMLIYPQRVGTIINMLAVVVVFLGISKKILKPGSGREKGLEIINLHTELVLKIVNVIEGRNMLVNCLFNVYDFS